MRAILVLIGMTAVAFGVIMLLITVGFAVQVDPALSGAAWRAAVLAKLTGNLAVGWLMGAVGLVGGVILIVLARRGAELD